MSDKKLSALDAVTTVDDTDEFLVARSGASKKITGANLKAAAGSGNSSSSLNAVISIPSTGADSGSDTPVELSGTYPSNYLRQTTCTGPTTANAADKLYCWVELPVLPDGAEVAFSVAEFMVCNLDASQKLYIACYDPITLTNQDARNFIPFANAEVIEQIGADLQLVEMVSGSDHVAAIETTAGGQFLQQFFAQLVYTPPT